MNHTPITPRESATLRAALTLWLARLPEQNPAEVEAIAASVDNNPLGGSEIAHLLAKLEKAELPRAAAPSLQCLDLLGRALEYVEIVAHTLPGRSGGESRWTDTEIDAARELAHAVRNALQHAAAAQAAPRVIVTVRRGIVEVYSDRRDLEVEMVDADTDEEAAHDAATARQEEIAKDAKAGRLHCLA